MGIKKDYRRMLALLIACVFTFSVFIGGILPSQVGAEENVGGIDGIIFEVEGKHIKANLVDWAEAFYVGSGHPLFDYMEDNPIIGIVVGGEYYDFVSYSQQYYIHDGVFADAIADTEKLDPDIVDITWPFLEVIEVSAITKTGVEVVIKEVFEDLEGAEVKVVDPANDVHPVEPEDLEEGDTEATFEFVEELDEVMYGLWTVDGVEFLVDPTEVEALADLKVNTNMELTSEDNVVTAVISYPDKIYKELDGFTVDALIEVKKGNVLKDGTRIEIKYNDDKVGVVEVNDNWDDFDERAIYLSKLIAEAEPDGTIFKPFAAFDDTTRACILAHEGREDTWELAIEPSDPKLSDIKVTSQVSKDWNDPFDIASDETRVDFSVPDEVIVEDTATLERALANQNISTIVLADGEYEGSFTVEHSQTLVAENEHGATIKGLLAITADDVTVDGLKMRDYQVGAGGSFPVIEVVGENVTVQNMDLFTPDGADEPYEIRVRPGAHNAKILNNVIDTEIEGGHPTIHVQDADDALVEGNELYGWGAIVGRQLQDTTMSVKDNYVENAVDEGIWFWGVEGTDLIIEGNTVADYDDDETGSKAFKIVDKPASVNVETKTLAMYNAILADNPGIDSVEFYWLAVVKNATELNAALGNENIETILVKDGNYVGNFTVQYSQDLVAENQHGAVIIGSFMIEADNVKIDGFKVDNQEGDSCLDMNVDEGIKIYNNFFTNSMRGMRLGGHHGPHDDIEVVGNTFKTDYGIAQTENTTNLLIVDNVFDITEEEIEEAIGLGIGVQIVDRDGDEVPYPDDIVYLEEENTFENGKVVDYRDPVYNSDKATFYETIQDAINAADEGETIKVAPGNYEETLEFNKDDLTLKSFEGAEETVIKGGTIRFFDTSGVTLEGFTINNEDGDRAIGPNNSDGTTIKNNIIINSFRGVQGDWHGVPTNLVIAGNTFETDYGVAGTEGMTGLHIKNNTFDTPEEAIGLGVGVEVVDENGVEVVDYVEWLQDNNEFINDGQVNDYRNG